MNLSCLPKNVKLKQLAICILVFNLILACQFPKKQESAPNSDNPYIDAILNSATADNPDDTSHMPSILIPEQDFNYGTVIVGDTFSHDFKFYNTGNARLLISNIQGTCGCTRATYPTGFIPPKDSGIIKLTFVPLDNPGEQDKPITIIANTRPNTTIIQFKGMVKSKNK